MKEAEDSVVTYSCAGENVDAMLGMVQSLNHCDQCAPCITFFVHTRQVVVEFNLPLIHLFIHFTT